MRPRPPATVDVPGLTGDDPSGPDDPFDGLVLDESFVLGARRSEGSAAERTAAAARSRLAHDDLEDRRQREVAAARAATRRADRRRRTRWFVGMTTLVAVVVAGGWWLSTNAESLLQPRDAVAAGSFGDVFAPTHASNRPTPTAADRTEPFATPLPTLAEGPHAFVARGPDGAPAAYDPCRPIPVVVNSRTAPAGVAPLLDSALAEISRRTGLQFVREGVSDEVPSLERDAFQPDRYGDRWAPVLIAWTDPTEVATLGTEVVGVGGSTQIETDGHAVYVSGLVALDGPELAEAMARPDGPGRVEAVILHELGHLVGLDHVDDPGQLMYEANLGQTALAAGDLSGLTQLGTGPCIDRL